MLRNIICALKSFVFPAHCLHCQEEIDPEGLLCEGCSYQIEFAVNQDPLQVRALEAEGPTLSFLKASQSGISEVVAKAMSAFMVVAFERSAFPYPSFLIASPKNKIFNDLLARNISEFMSIPCIDPFFFGKWKRSICLCDEMIMIVDTTSCHQQELQVLFEETAAKNIYFLTFC